MKHYTTWPMQNGAVAVGYVNHRAQFCPVLECPTFEVAAREAAQMTRAATLEALAPVQAQPSGGNRYMRGLR